MNAALSAYGIKTIRENGRVFLYRNGLMIDRPHIDGCAQACLVSFGVVIIGG